MKSNIPVFDVFNPTYYARLKAKVLKAKNPQPEMILAIDRAAEREAQAEIHFITLRDSRTETEHRAFLFNRDMAKKKRKYARLKAKVLKAKNPQPEMIRAIAEMIEREAQAELKAYQRRHYKPHSGTKKRK